MIDHKMLDYCETQPEVEAVKATIEHGSRRKAAIALGKNHRTVSRAVSRVQDRAAKHGYSDEGQINESIPEHMKLTSTWFVKDPKTGEELYRGYAAKEDRESYLRIVEDVAKGFMDEIDPTQPVAYTPSTEENLAACYLISDFHIGMYADADESGSDWNMEKAEETLSKWFGTAITQAPNANTAVLTFLGDTLHTNGFQPVTPIHGHVLDAAARYHEMVRMVIRLLRKVIHNLLHNHENVHLIIVEGNHDGESSLWLRNMFDFFYEQEPRVTVDCSPRPYHCFEWGNTSLFFTHGHLVKMNQADRVFANEFREVFGRTKYSYGHVGHYHSSAAKENGIMPIEQHRTLASRDSYAARHGYDSDRSASVILYHKEYGDVGRNTISPERAGVG